MGRPLRHLPYPNTTFEITTRTIHGRLLLRPSKELNEIVLGIIGRALAMFPIQLHAFSIASNHVHLLLTTTDVFTLSAFMCFVNGNLAKEAGRLQGWREKFWGRRYRAIPILDDRSLVSRLRYALAHGCKEGLVLRPEDWPGANCVRALTRGEKLRGTWFDRTREYLAKRRQQKFSKREFTTETASRLRR